MNYESILTLISELYTNIVNLNIENDSLQKENEQLKQALHEKGKRRNEATINAPVENQKQSGREPISKDESNEIAKSSAM